MDKRHSFTDFIEVIRALRAENGCPWDRAQTHDSLRPCMTEEAAELLAAIRIYDRTGNAENLREELGDVLLQVALHSVIAEEEGLFTMDEVIEEVYQKMIRRHPHVFGKAEADTADKVLVNWEEIKKQEKEGKSWISSPLREIPLELPALARACKIIKKADKLYGLPEGKDGLFGRMRETLDQLEDAGQEDEAFEEAYAELLWQAAELAYRRGKAPEQILTDKISAMIEYFEPDCE